MREIKFRAWIPKWNTMYYDIYSIYNLNNSPVSFDISKPEYGVETIYIKEDNAPLMQYTGIKDKNGTEIYERDIVKSWITEEHLAKIDVIEDVTKLYALPSGHSFDNGWMNWEVVGNIWENSELLK